MLLGERVWVDHEGVERPRDLGGEWGKDGYRMIEVACLQVFLLVQGLGF